MYGGGVQYVDGDVPLLHKIRAFLSEISLP